VKTSVRAWDWSFHDKINSNSSKHVFYFLTKSGQGQYIDFTAFPSRPRPPQTVKGDAKNNGRHGHNLV
jgi:hypothetical protein